VAATQAYSIGAAAEQTGVTAHTLRYYEKIGLLTGIAKGINGKRQFSVQNIQSIQFIKRAQTMQFSLDEIKQLIMLDQSAQIAKPEARSMVKEKLGAIEERLQELHALKQNLSELLSACEASTNKQECPILEGIKK